MIFTVTNSNLIYSFSFTPEKVHIQINDTSNNLFMTCLEMPVEVLQIIEQQRQQFNTFHMSQVPLTENQLGTQQMSSEVAAESGHDLPDIFDANFVPGPINFNFPWENYYNGPYSPSVFDDLHMRGEEEDMDNSESEHELVIIEDDDENTPPTTPESERPTQPPPLQRNNSNVFTPIENVSEYVYRTLFD